jgi:serine/threonine protein kinase
MQRDRLQRLITAGPPDARFLWPIEPAVSLEADGFGYVMELRPADSASLASLFTGEVSVRLEKLAEVGLELAESFLSLHAKGYCYRDLSLGNFFFHPSSGKVYILDNDNIGIDGEDDAGVLGTIRFMAPEVVLGQAPPSADTDRFSLAVVLFYTLMMGHPFEGKQEASIRILNESATRLLYGQRPVFIFDPQDASNRPVQGVHDGPIQRWRVFPAFIRELFERSFTVGIREPRERVRESEWKLAFAKLIEGVIHCPHCGKENILETESVDLHPEMGSCWSCGADLRSPLNLVLENGSAIHLSEGAELYSSSITGSEETNERPVGRVVRHPVRSSILGIRNESERQWVVTMPSGMVLTLLPGRTVRIKVRIRIDFGIGSGVVDATS